MVGITLTPEQIRRAPAEVRRWLQGEITASLGIGFEPAPASGVSHLWPCSPRDAAAIFNKISSLFPVVNVFFELGRDGEFVTAERLVAHRLADMLRHTRLQNIEQLAGCLQLIGQVARELTNDPEIALYVIDARGYCLVPVETQKSIAEVWSHVVSRPEVAGDASPSAADAPRASGSFPPLHGAVPQEATHMGFNAPGAGG